MYYRISPWYDLTMEERIRRIKHDIAELAATVACLEAGRAGPQEALENIVRQARILIGDAHPGHPAAEVLP